jgi:hypothetical protein
MCQRFIEDFTDKVIEKIKEPSRFYLFSGSKDDDLYIKKIMSFSSKKTDILDSFIENFKEINVYQQIELIIYLSYFFEICDKCECFNCLADYYKREEVVNQEPCIRTNIIDEIRRNIDSVLDKTISELRKIDIMEIEKYTKYRYFIVEDTTGAVEKILEYY